MRRLVKKIIWWMHSIQIKTPVEYCCIEACWSFKDTVRGRQHDIHGWIPRQVYERITGDTFKEGAHNFISKTHSIKIKNHPLFVADEVFNSH